ncbi:hypothetical protein G7Y89_g2441 [Cudoniella acicularis]|uniref:Cytochrome P450 n=1 Tax=Cudoniella acicularis TaxID=354080 RepID=A0A8H4RUE5_9HELO|nr:hypothetical protein G7Y89_g2441 [Cudoniella acicularis]
MSIIPALYSLSITTLLSVAVLLGFGVYALTFSSRYKFPSKSPKLVKEGYPILGTLRFFTARWDFFQHARAHSTTGNFSFFLGKHPVVGLSGEKGRQIFFESRDLDFTEGYAVLFGQSPNSLKEDGIQNIDKDFAGPGGYFARRITRMLNKENFGKSFPKLISDVKTTLDGFALDPTGITDPFESIYKIVFQLTIRMVGCDDIADDPKLLDKTLNLYETIEASSTTAAVLFPKFPSMGIIKRTVAGGRLYVIFNKIVNERKQSGKRGEDPLQFLMDQGDDIQRIIEFIVGALFAGLLNSGVNAAWVLVYLAKDPYWMGRVREEIKGVAAKYSNNKDAPLVDQLSQVPVEAWESEFPMVDLCLKDSIRLQLLGTAFRKNISGKDIPTGSGNEIIPNGAFVTYHTGDVHLDPTIYKDPKKWDPSRYLPDRAEDKKKPYAYMGWGMGRHPCLGMRFAKLEQNIITAFFCAMFDYELVDKAGKPMTTTPPVDFNGHSATKPSPSIYLKYKTI